MVSRPCQRFDRKISNPCESGRVRRPAPNAARLLLRPRTLGARGAIGFGLQAGYEKQIDDLVGAVGHSDGDRSPGWRLRQELRMIHGNGPAVGQKDFKRLERPRLVHLSQLFDRHVRYFSWQERDGNNLWSPMPISNRLLLRTGPLRPRRAIRPWFQAGDQ